MSEWTAGHQRLWDKLEEVDPITPEGEARLSAREAAAAAAQARAAAEQAAARMRDEVATLGIQLAARKRRAAERNARDPWGWARAGLLERT